MDKAKEAAAVYKTNANGETALKGYNAVDPTGHVVLVQSLPSDGGWRYATAEDLKQAEDAEKARATPAPAGPAKKK